ncbi:MAG TPA: lysophospholipid acyltransferase family protein [Myxococcaceae bacterium]|jgi:1-acyl-sn-glycerol-3-phosphate acyltransferase|nr:lysophospholipid acyltransferase family protein [Myxococcaceae bacterium]
MLRNLLCVLSVVVWTAVLLPVACLAMLLTLDAGASIAIARRLWAPLLLRVAGARVEVEGRAHVDASRPAIYASNHQSTLDIPVLFVALPVDLRFVAKEQLRWVPLVGWYLQLAGHVIVDRGNRQRAIASLDRAARRILRRRVSLIAFPEGTRSRDGRILPFKHGPFGLALKASVPVVPVTIEGSARVMPRRSWRITPGVVRVRIGAPVEVARFEPEDRAGLARLVRETIVRANLDLGGLGGDALPS